MALQPKYSLKAGSLTSNSDSPQAGPKRFIVERDINTPIDGLRISLAECGQLQAGDAVELELGDENYLERVFTGSIAELRPSLRGCEIFCLGKTLALMELRVSSCYQNQSAGSIVKDLVNQAGLESGEIEDGIELPWFCVERRLAAQPQLRKLAKKLGYSLFSDREGKIHFCGLGPAANLGGIGLGAFSNTASQAASLQNVVALPSTGNGFEFAKHLIACCGNRQAPLQKAVVAGGESPMSGQGEDKTFWLTDKDSDYQDTAGQGDELLVIDRSARSKDMAARLAAGYAAELNRNSADIRLRVLGHPKLELGAQHSVSGTGKNTLNAQGYIKSLQHRFGPHEGFITDIVLSTEAAL